MGIEHDVFQCNQLSECKTLIEAALRWAQLLKLAKIPDHFNLEVTTMQVFNSWVWQISAAASPWC